MSKTKNFDPLIDKKLTCTCGHAACDRRTVDQSTLDKLQIIRDAIGVPMRINSGARCTLHDDEKGRINTDHQSCKTVDVAFADELQGHKMIAYAARLGATALGFYKKDKFVHLCFKEGDRIRYWIE